MTVTVPKWAIAAGVIAVVAVVAFWLGRGSGSDGSAETAGVEQEALACSKKLALPGVERFIRRNGEDRAPLLDEQTGNLSEFVYSEIIKCTDLNGDGTQEMVLIADGVGAGGSHPVSWFILEQRNGRWEGVFRRTVPTPQVEVDGELVRESTPGYLKDDSFGNPSYRRVGEVVFDGRAYSYAQPGQGSSDRRIVLSPETKRVVQLGSLEVETALPADAKKAFGRPSIFSWFDKESCPTTWSDLGLTINFANLGGLDACQEGRVGSFDISGSPAETSGWRGPKGLSIGMTFNEVLKAYPATSRTEYEYMPSGVDPTWESWTLLEGPSPYSENGKTPVITGYFDGRLLKRLDFYIGAAGE